VKINLGDLPHRGEDSSQSRTAAEFWKWTARKTINCKETHNAAYTKRQETRVFKYEILSFPFTLSFSRDLKVRLCRDKTMDLNKKG